MQFGINGNRKYTVIAIRAFLALHKIMQFGINGNRKYTEIAIRIGQFSTETEEMV